MPPATSRCCAPRSAPRHRGRLVSRPPRHLRDARAGATHARGATRRQRAQTRLGRALAELGIGSIAAQSPQAKGRVERTYGHPAGPPGGRAARGRSDRPRQRQSRAGALPAPLQPALRGAAGQPRRGVASLARRAQARAHLLPRSTGARWPMTAPSVRAPPFCSCQPVPNGRTRAGQRLQLQLRLDGRLVVWDGERELVSRPAPADPAQLRALHVARPELGSVAPTAATATSPPKHPWQELTPGSKLQQRRRREGLTKSQTT
jgi:hypothetical protein